MPSTLLRGFAKVIFWRYRRGSWQYDILCALILAFIFLTPREVFDGRAFMDEQVSPKTDEERVLNTLQGKPTVDIE